MAELNLHPIANAPDTAELTPLAATPEGWIEIVLADFDAFLQDHASAEKKASGMALSMVSHYPDQTSLVAAMVDLAVEELNHYKEVMRLLMTRGVTPAADRKDPYVAKHIDDAELRKFYHAIAKSEARHWHLFVTLARNLCPHLPVDARFCELAELENALVAELPLRPALH